MAEGPVVKGHAECRNVGDGSRIGRVLVGTQGKQGTVGTVPDLGDLRKEKTEGSNKGAGRRFESLFDTGPRLLLEFCHSAFSAQGDMGHGIEELRVGADEDIEVGRMIL